MIHSLYRHFGADDELLYIGISLSALQRLTGHRRHGSSWLTQITRVQIEYFPTEKEARQAETLAIRSERPLYNKAGLHKPQRKRNCAFCGKRFAPTIKEPSFCSQSCLDKCREQARNKFKPVKIDNGYASGLLSNLG
jgi:hypothetical protein